MILIQQFNDFKEKICSAHKICSCSRERSKEIELCLKRNIENPLIEKIILLNEKDYNLDILKSDKIEIHKITSRLNYQKAMQFADRFKDKIIIISNNDIYFDESLEEIKKYNAFDNKIIALTRHELDKFGNVLPQNRVKPFFDMRTKGYYKVRRIWSHDAWIYKNPLKQFDCDFFLGIMGCENSFINAARNAGIECLNGYPYIRAIHCHSSNFRPNFNKPYDIINNKDNNFLKKDIHGNDIDINQDNYCINSKIELKQFLRSLNIEDRKNVMRAINLYRNTLNNYSIDIKI